MTLDIRCKRCLFWNSVSELRRTNMNIYRIKIQDLWLSYALNVHLLLEFYINNYKFWWVNFAWCWVLSYALLLILFKVMNHLSSIERLWESVVDVLVRQSDEMQKKWCLIQAKEQWWYLSNFIHLASKFCLSHCVSLDAIPWLQFLIPVTSSRWKYCWCLFAVLLYNSLIWWEKQS